MVRWDLCLRSAGAGIPAAVSAASQIPLLLGAMYPYPESVRMGVPDLRSDLRSAARRCVRAGGPPTTRRPGRYRGTVWCSSPVGHRRHGTGAGGCSGGRARAQGRGAGATEWGLSAGCSRGRGAGAWGSDADAVVAAVADGEEIDGRVGVAEQMSGGVHTEADAFVGIF